MTSTREKIARTEILPWIGKVSILSSLISGAWVEMAIAQVTIDKTLNSEITQSGSIVTINGGTRVGKNLFHSFKEFSAPVGTSVYFNNGTGIQNIIARIIGGTPSNIDGLIQANGNANLFLINPGDIFFGKEAQLKIGGSFFATTANSLKFADGTELGVFDGELAVTISIPSGLEFSHSTGFIKVQGTGNPIIPNTLFLSSITNNNSTGLEVEQGKTLALIGGNLNVEGGTLVAPGGEIKLGSVSSGFVSLKSNNNNWTFDYEGITNQGDISISNQALINSSGISAGSVQIYGNKISLTDGSVVLIQNQGETASGSLDVNAFNSLILKGASPDGNVSSSILTEALNTGRSGDIYISTPQLVLEDGARIGASTFSDAPGGNVAINASDSVQLLENKAVNPFRQGNIISSIGAATFASGNAGSLQISTKELLITNGGAVASSTTGAGKGGNAIVNANSISVIGTEPRRCAPSAIAASAFNTGNAGSLTINTSQLELKDGATVNSTSVAGGNAGSLTINAKDFIEITGIDSNSQPSLISSSVNFAIPSVRNIFRLSSQPPTGAAGDVSIYTSILTVNQGGLIAVANQGTGNAGRLEINAMTVKLDNFGSITASALGGEGGNITINAQTLEALENSSITANAIEGRGGNVKIDTNKLLLSLNSVVTATSDRGMNGTVKIEAFEAGGKNV